YGCTHEPGARTGFSLFFLYGEMEAEFVHARQRIDRAGRGGHRPHRRRILCTQRIPVDGGFYRADLLVIYPVHRTVAVRLAPQGTKRTQAFSGAPLSGLARTVLLDVGLSALFQPYLCRYRRTVGRWRAVSRHVILFLYTAFVKPAATRR